MGAGIKIVIYTVIFLYGIVIGSFLNVCIYRIPLGQSLSKQRSHCMSCGYQLRWFDLIPLLRGKCRKCGAKISPQYPIVEATNGILYVLIFGVHGMDSVTSLLESILYCLMASALLALSVIDFRTFIIPFGFNVFIFILGVVNIAYRVFFVKAPDIWLCDIRPALLVRSDGGRRCKASRSIWVFDRMEAFIAILLRRMHYRSDYSSDSDECVQARANACDGAVSFCGDTPCCVVGISIYRLVHEVYRIG